MFTITAILFFTVFARYIYCVWNANLDSIEAIICLMIFPITILLLLSEGPTIPVLLLLGFAGMFSFSRKAIKRGDGSPFHQ